MFIRIMKVRLIFIYLFSFFLFLFLFLDIGLESSVTSQGHRSHVIIKMVEGSGKNDII